MLFNSFEFLIFFIITTTLFYVLEHKYRWFMLLFASCYFYSAFVPVYLLILFFTIIIDYLAGIQIEKSKDKKRLCILWISLIANIGILVFFKYYNFFTENINTLASYININIDAPTLNIALPIGLSFHTFQAMSYTIEVYRGNQKAEQKFGIYALYVMFYPQLVAGPIERPQNILHQFYQKRQINFTQIKNGLELMLWGFFKKIVIADRLAIVVNEVYNNSSEYNGLTLVVATIFFSFQIYCDFSGYSDIAIGAAKTMGFNLMKNFNTPYFSKSISEFWNRWHISLSTWFRDYVYIPMGGNRTVKWKWYYNIVIVFLLSGIWHGAKWTFVIWGILHGLLLILENIFKIKEKKNTAFLNFILLGKTFLLISIGWIFFRANSLEDAYNIIRNILDFKNYSLSQLSFYIVPSSKNKVFSIDFFLSYFFIILLIFSEYLFYYKIKFSELKYGYKVLIYSIGILGILLLGAFEKNEFIYFQF